MADRISLIISALDAKLPDSADELVDEIWYEGQKGRKKTLVTQEQYDKITEVYHSMVECLEVI